MRAPEIRRPPNIGNARGPGNANWTGSRLNSTPILNAAKALEEISIDLQLMAWAVIFDDDMAHEPENVELIERHAKQLQNIQRWARDQRAA
ncbi:hypothetical protein [Elongatibacter sediminis]|uniref:Uncharacterized protein n=1 Tax=Elongatibacter sediminis TaxID=3119006 RepID=A0AAW9R998_9GAMM